MNPYCRMDRPHGRSGRDGRGYLDVPDVPDDVAEGAGGPARDMGGRLPVAGDWREPRR